MNADGEDKAAPSQSLSPELAKARLNRPLSGINPMDNDLKAVIDEAERRRIQNRTAQRKYRERLRHRLGDLGQRQSISEFTSSQNSPGYIHQHRDALANIDSLALSCNVLLESLVGTAQAPEETQPEQGLPADLCHLLEDELGRFRVWAANLGAFQDSKSPRSLDYRLRDGPVMRSSVVSGLKRLIDTGSRVGEIMAGKRPNRSAPAAADASITEDSLDTASECTTELEQLLGSLHSSISHLFSLSILIRRLRPKGRLPGVDSLDSLDSSADVTYVEDKFPKARQVPWLAQRMGDAITRRRELIRYRQQHRAKISKAPEVLTNVNTETETIATSYREEDVVPTLQSSSSNEPEAASIYTSATSFMTSTMDSEGTGLNIPDLSDMVLDGVQLNYGEPIECPYCRTVQNLENRYEWKKHVFTDLQPYVCIFKDCSLKLFETRHEWFEHEITYHQKHWCCTLCPGSQVSYPAEEDIAAHIKSDHRANVTENQLPLLLEACEQQSQTLDTSSCPFCVDWKEDPVLADNSKAFCRHVARHLRLLALVSIPLAIEGLEIREPMPDEASDSSIDEASDENSRHGDNDHEDPGPQWTMDSVQQWLRDRGFSQAWQQTFKDLNIQGSSFTNLGAEPDPMGKSSAMNTLILPMLFEVCNSGHTGWNQTREHDEGKRLQLLIRSTMATPSRDSYKTQAPPLGEDIIQEGAPANPPMSRAERFEDEKTRIISSCFSKKAPDGDQLMESYITHVSVIEYASDPGNPPLDSNRVGSNMKLRVLALAVRQSGRVRMHKIRENPDRSFSIGKTWNFEDLNSVENPPDTSETTGVILRLGKPYYWEMATIKEKLFFVASCIKIHRKYTGGQFLRLIGFSIHEENNLLGRDREDYYTWLKSQSPEGE
ncbi:hypothetical protein EDB81DRAFT_693283 [Dactylonectria macrodidyma]|uniref:BZIP domain-containing protein n=1 Tax=Dactylonectria macrodidyma TaxID=307937 RepID=A0A9P9IWJ3_9HYPO|nr:hypothetical protein EDB81DRAFT_693283 [Dactylonectria macrodidyma]